MLVEEFIAGHQAYTVEAVATMPWHRFAQFLRAARERNAPPAPTSSADPHEQRVIDMQEWKRAWGDKWPGRAF